MDIFRPLKNLVAACILNVAVRFVDRCIEDSKQKLQVEEQLLRERLARLLAIPDEKIAVRFVSFSDGSILPSVELKTRVSRMQLDRATDFLDGLTPIRQNVRRPTPAIN